MFIECVALCVVACGVSPSMASADGGRPLGAVVLFRHGDRTPVAPYPKDPYSDPKYWPAPWGELTITGMRQHYALGGRLRNEYNHLIGPIFNKDEIYVRSTDTDRTLMSAQANLAGIFPIPDPDEITPGLSWRPTPVHTIPLNEDALLWMDSPCAKFTSEMNQLLQTDYFKSLMIKFKPLFEYASENAGYEYKGFKQLAYLYDILLIEELYNFTLPEWTKKVYPDALHEISQISFTLDTFTPSLAKLRVGPLIKQITEILMAIDKNEVSQKLWVFSTHDTTIANLLNALNLMKYELPPYASNLIFELIPGKTSNKIRVRYQFDELRIPGCGASCSLHQWITNYSSLFPDDHKAECEINLDVGSTLTENMAIYLLLSIIVIILLLNIATCVYMRKSFGFFSFEKSPA